MNWDAFITCAVTGSGDSAGKSDKVPVTPQEIADAAIEAAKEGAAIAHIHVRDPKTGAASRDPELYRQVVDRIRSQETDIIVNLTAGMGGDVVFGGVEQPLPLDPVGTDMVGATERMEHVRDLLPEICTLDCGTMNFSEGDYVMTNTPSILREMARQMTALGVRPEIEIFDTGHLVMAKQLVAEGHHPRLVSMPSWELFEAQPLDYRESVLPPKVTARVAVEAGMQQGWDRYLGVSGRFIGMCGFGASAPYQQLYEYFGITKENVLEAAKSLMG